MSVRSFWRRNVSRKWVSDLRVCDVSVDRIRPINDQTLGGEWMYYRPNKRFYIYLSGASIDEYQMELLNVAHKNCYRKNIDPKEYEESMKNYLLTQ